VSNSLVWFKSSYSGSGGTSCVEVANLPDGGRAVRDSKNPDGGHLVLSRSVWQSFTNQIKAGHLG
jgi:hypothetical protein